METDSFIRKFAQELLSAAQPLRVIDHYEKRFDDMLTRTRVDEVHRVYPGAKRLADARDGNATLESKHFVDYIDRRVTDLSRRLK